ncbi:hypothetical protein [Coraliomargarita sinensis]|uniref:hypothetical protein n=1 Tax=Coraliomargarita sinensis TaxID=2174842 RepID=UPI000D72614E|nr:hypothetical protein [Coraliomargarita sinensis]
MAKVIKMADVRREFFPECEPENRPDGKPYNRPIIKAFRRGEIQGVPTRTRIRKGFRQILDFRITRAEWRRLHENGIVPPVDDQSEVRA